MKYLASILALLIALGPVTATAAGTSDNTYTLGGANNATKTFIFNKSGTVKPKLRYNQTNSKFEFANDGAIFKALGSGAGGGGGIVLNEDPGFEDGVGSYVASGGTFAVTSVAANVGFGLNAASWTPSATGQTLSTAPIAIPPGLYGKSGTISLYYKGGDANYIFEVTDGTNAIATSSPLTASTLYSAKKAMAFTFPASGNVVFRLRALAAAAQIFVDDFKGGAEFVQGTQNQGLVASAKYAPTAGCNINYASGTFDDGVAGTCSAPVFSGSGVIASGVPVALKIPLLPKGEYRVVANMGRARSGTATTNYGVLRLWDGTNIIDSKLLGITGGTSANQIYGGNLDGRVNYATDQTNITFKIQGKSFAGSTAIENTALDEMGIEIAVYRLGSAAGDSTQAITIEQTGWRVAGTITGGNLDLVSSTSPIELTNANLIMALEPGSSGAQIPCSGTNPATGLTCAAGNESLGVYLPGVPTAGVYEACAEPSIFSSFGIAASAIGAFKWAETTNGAQTVVQLPGGDSLNGYESPNHNATSFYTYQSPRICRDFVFNDTGPRTLRLMTTAAITGTGSVVRLMLGGTNVGGVLPKMPFTVRRKVEFADVVRVLPANIVPTIVALTTAGAGTWVVPAGVSKVQVTAIGGGGGGGDGQGVVGGFGGCSGATAIKALAVTPGQSLAYTIGTGGARNAAGVSTVFNSTIIGTGGSAGVPGQSQPSSCTQGTGGDLNLNGGPGGTGSINSANLSGGNGGSSIYGGGGVGAFAGAGQAGTSYGGGGAGGGSSGSLAGGNGATGAIVLMY